MVSFVASYLCVFSVLRMVSFKVHLCLDKRANSREEYVSSVLLDNINKSLRLTLSLLFISTDGNRIIRNRVFAFESEATWFLLS